MIEQAAYEIVLLQEAEAMGLRGSPTHRAYVARMRERELLAHAQETLIDGPTRPTFEELRDYLRANVDRERFANPLPPTATWRFMHFAVASDASEEVREAAWERAQEAREAVLAGEEFMAVAERLATPPAAGRAGHLMGPLEFQGRIFPEVEEVLLSAPLGEVTDLIDTPLGPMLFLVEGRELERYPEEIAVLSDLAQGLVQERRLASEEQIWTGIRERHPVEILPPSSLDLPDETPVLTVGEHSVTLGDLRLRSHLSADPALELARLTTPQALASMIDDHLLLAEMESRGLFDDPEFQEQLNLRLRHEELVPLEQRLYAARIESPTEEELVIHHLLHGEEFRTTVVTVEALLLTAETLTRLTSSDLPYAWTQAMESMRDPWERGDSFESILETAGAASEGDGAMRWDLRLPQSLPPGVRALIDSLEPGQFSRVQITSEGAMVARLVTREEGIPSLEEIRPQVLNALLRERAPERDLREELLEQYNYRLVVDHTRLRWEDEATEERLILLPDEE
jgi:hypothetical protein